MLVFLDFEASSLSKGSYSVEIAWVYEDGRSRSFLIRPAPDWTDWSSEAEGIHGISREVLETDGADVEVIVDEMVDTLSEHDLYASAPSWDGKWLSVLLRAAGHPRHELRLRKSDEAFEDAARAILRTSIPDEDIKRLVTEVIEQSEVTAPVHRALPDALLELERLKAVRNRAQTLSHRPDET